MTRHNWLSLSLHPIPETQDNENEKCTGINDTAYVWVEPTARITVTPKQDTICNGTQVSITLTSPISSHPCGEVQVCDRGACRSDSCTG